MWGFQKFGFLKSGQGCDTRCDKTLQHTPLVINQGGVTKEPKTIKFGVLGASQVATYALVWPTQRIPQAEIVAVAARDGNRARQYAKDFKIQRSYGSYDELLSDPEIDAVYVGLPNGLHGQWARKALSAGKHVLCEKPFGANAQEAKEVQAFARSKGLMCREAFHYREHPLATRLRELLLGPAAATTANSVAGSAGQPVWQQAALVPGGDRGVLGRLHHIDVQLLIPQWVFGNANIRFQEQLAGGAMMDAGCYCVNILRLVTGAEPQVVKATATTTPGTQVVDSSMTADVSWPTVRGLTGKLSASLAYPGWFPITQLTATGQNGTLTCKGFVVPFFGHRITVKRTIPSASISSNGQDGVLPGVSAGASVTEEKLEEWTEHAYGVDHETTYHHQLKRFVEDLRVLKGYTDSTAPPGKSAKSVQQACIFDAEDCVANQTVIDNVYRAAGLPLRLPTAQWLALKNGDK